MNLETLKTTPIVQICLNKLGYEVDKKHDSKSWRALISQTGERIITKSCPNSNGHYLFKSTSNDVSGTVIDLLLKVEQKTWREINAIFSNDLDYQKNFNVAQKPSKAPVFLTPKAILAKMWLKHRKNENYLLSRGITQKTIANFNVSADKNTVFFPLVAVQGNKLSLKSAIKYSNFGGQKSQKFISTRGGSFSLLVPKNNPSVSLLKKGDCPKIPQKLLFFESPIDALSYFQLFLGELETCNFLLLSTCGSPSASFFENFSNTLTFFKAKSVCFEFDNDKYGELLSKKLLALLPQEVAYITSCPIVCKDYNELLTSKAKNKIT